MFEEAQNAHTQISSEYQQNNPHLIVFFFKLQREQINK